jgi:LmbE family N-acetylglucosaminyl deacetylase
MNSVAGNKQLQRNVSANHNKQHMKRLLKIAGFILLAVILIIGGHIFYLTTLSAKEKYPADSYLGTEPNKTALIIVAHDDDMVGSAGTITMLCKNGWNIHEMCFYQKGGLYFKKDSAKNPIRKKDLERVAAIQGLSGTDPIDFNFRNDMQTEKSYMPMPYSKFAENYKEDSVTTYIAGYIEKYKPSVVFTLDNIMGGYGHPDHVLISRQVLAYCRLHKNDPGFSVKRIYQPVFPPSLAERVLGKLPVYPEAKKVYECDGMPLPDVQVNIYSFAAQKKASMQAYTTEQNSLKQIWPYYNWYPSWIYFKIFDRDFFRIIDVGTL